MQQFVSHINRKRLNSHVKDEDENPLHCKICLQIFNEPYSTICGHTFCRSCITRSIQHSPQCPICDTNLDVKRLKTLCPNFTVSSMIDKILVDVETKKEHSKGHSSQTVTGQPDNGDQILQMIQNQQLSLESVQRISELLKRRQTELELNNQQIQNLLLNDLFDRMIAKRQNTAKKIQAELDTLKRDKQHIFNTLTSQLSPSSLQRLVPDSNQVMQLLSVDPSLSNTSNDHLAPLAEENLRSDSPSTPQTLQFQANLTEKLYHYRRRMCRHVASLESAYFGSKTSLNVNKNTDISSSLGSVSHAELDEFSETVKRLYQYGDMKLLATLNYNLESNSSLSIVSSIEFDKDGEFFVIAGVAKKIKLYNYEAIVNFEGELHYPLEQLICNSKISNISWNPYNKNMLASSDYEGTVQLWDTAAAVCTRTFKEHEKRCWTVQFNNIDPHLMASGSDDGKVKLWALHASQSVCTIDARVNVCCVYFSPKYRNQLVFGSSDHCVHLYDIRQPGKPLNVFRGHKKAVSYVKYANEDEVISASTDSNLRLWDVSTGKCLQTMRGHQNEKNFVGMATDGNHVVCGSENNRLYLYYKKVFDPLLSFDCTTRSVDNIQPTAPETTTGNATSSTNPSPSFSDPVPPTQHHSTNDFVSAVCWKRNTSIVLAANSQGQTFILQLK
uniref:RING-type domain-containing protein n=1 Tax=Meloidogyne incognita TaxID=6306 RepID=A0A914KRK3_MELIC